MITLLGSGLGGPGLGPTTFYAPNNAAIGVSDHLGVAIDAAKIRFTRPTVDGNGYANCTPGARVRFKTTAAAFLVRLRYTNLVTRVDTYNAGGVVLAEGALAQTFTRAQGPAGDISVYVGLPSAALRTIEIVMPYCASVDFTGLDVPVGDSISAAAARTSTVYAAVGDSITHGFFASEVVNSWAYKLAAAKGWQLKNHGYGSRQVQPADGTTLQSLAPSVATYLIGYNNFVAQTPLATFKADYISFISNFRSAGSTAKLYCLTPTYSPNTAAISLESYRQQIRDALAAIGDSHNVLIEGESLALHNATSFPDNVHPSDVGANQIVAALAPVVAV